MTTHTPGPWTLTVGVSLHDTIWNTGGDFRIATAEYVPNRLGGWETQDANARLIAAAPELLLALQKLTDAISFAGRAATLADPNIKTIHANARAAIANATGEKP